MLAMKHMPGGSRTGRSISCFSACKLLQPATRKGLVSRRRESAVAIRAVFPRPASGPPARIRETYMVICALSPLPVRVAITRFQFGAIVGKGRRSVSEYSSCGSNAMTNLSPLVNTRGPIFTHPEGIVLRPVYHVCDLHRSQLARSSTRTCGCPASRPRSPARGSVRCRGGDAVATVDRPAGTLALSLANLHPAEPLECVIWVPGRTGPAVDADGRLARGLQRHLLSGRRQHLANFGRRPMTRAASRCGLTRSTSCASRRPTPRDNPAIAMSADGS